MHNKRKCKILNGKQNEYLISNETGTVGTTHTSNVPNANFVSSQTRRINCCMIFVADFVKIAFVKSLQNCYVCRSCF